MINRRLCKSKKFARLKSDRSRVLYVLMYTHTDCEGRINGDPEEIKTDCCPYLRYSKQKIAESVIDLADVELIKLYEVDYKPYIEFVDFDVNQPGLRKDREAPSTMPSPELVGSKSGATPALYLSLKLRLIKEVIKEEKEIDFDAENYIFLNIKDKDLIFWKTTYPACNIESELNKMADWLISNPKKRKKNYRRFISNWLSRTQDKGGSKTSTADEIDAWAEKQARKEEK